MVSVVAVPLRTWNGALAVRPLVAPVAVTVYAPGVAPAGTVNWVAKEPLVPLATGLATTPKFAVLWNVILTVSFCWKPLPVTLTTVPVGPDVGFNIMDAAAEASRGCRTPTARIKAIVMASTRVPLERSRDMPGLLLLALRGQKCAVG